MELPMESRCVFPMEIYRNWFAIMDLTLRQIYHEIGQPTLDMFIYLSLGARIMESAKIQVLIGKSLWICVIWENCLGLSSRSRILPYLLLDFFQFLSETLPYPLCVSFEAILDEYGRDIFRRIRGVVLSGSILWKSSRRARDDATFSLPARSYM